jgi:hypothetical protein
MNVFIVTSAPRKFLPGIVLALLAVAWSGCSFDYGRLNRDPEITAAFAESRFPSDLRYFYIGRSGMPHAIVGIREGYEFRSKFWKPVDPTSDMFQKMVRNPYGSDQSKPYGAYLLDAKGNRVGVVYTAFDLVDLRVTDDKGVYVFDPYRPTGGFKRPS